MTTEHLRPLLDDVHATHLFSGGGCQRGDVPPSVVRMVREGRMTAPAKPDGGVRGIVAVYVIRRLVANMMAQHEYALRTKAGCECVAHVLQGLTEINPLTSVTSVDGVGAFDMISSVSDARRVAEGWEGAHVLRDTFRILLRGCHGNHTIPQGEGGKAG